MLITGWIDDEDLPAGAPAASGGGYLVMKNSWGSCFGDSADAYVPYDWVKACGLAAEVVGDVDWPAACVTYFRERNPSSCRPVCSSIPPSS